LKWTMRRIRVKNPRNPKKPRQARARAFSLGQRSGAVLGAREDLRQARQAEGRPAGHAGQQAQTAQRPDHHERAGPVVAHRRL
jgi:hypothetical protein